MPRVTVVIPSYNHARFLEQTLGSVISQTYPDWELLFIDDGSSDESVELAHRIAEREPRIRILENPQNLGTYGTQQRGVELASSEWVAILNSDDYWSPAKLERQIELLDRSPKDVVSCYVLGMLDDVTGRNDAAGHHHDWPRTEVQDPMPYLAYENRILASGVLFRRDGLRFETSLRYSGDWIALIEAAMRGAIVCCPERLTTWRIHGDNEHYWSLHQAVEEIRVRQSIRRVEAQLGEGRDTALMSCGFGRNAMDLASLYFSFGLRWRVAPMLGQMLRYRPRRQSLRRWLAWMLPEDAVRRRLWPGHVDQHAATDMKEARRLIRNLEPIRFQFE